MKIWLLSGLVSFTLVSGPALANPDAESAAGGKTGERVLVLPYQPIFRSVDSNKAQTATKLLNKELAQKDGVVVLRGAVSEGPTETASLDEPKKWMKEAEDAEDKRRIGVAIQKRRQVIKSLEKNANALDKPEAYALAHHYLARALMWAGSDTEAKREIKAAARMDPNVELPRSAFSRLYRKWFVKAARETLNERPASLLVKSTLPGAKIMLDGREMDVAPVLLKKVVPGKHLLTARVEGVAPAADVVELKPGGKQEFTVRFGKTLGGDAVGEIAEALSENKVTSATVKSAVSAGQSAGAKFVVMGAMSRAEDNFRVHTFVVDVSKKAVKTLDVVNFDIDMLTAESDVLRIVQGIDSSISSFTDGKTAIARIENSIRKRSTVNEVVAAPSIRRKTARRTGPIKTTGKRIIKPLKGGTIQIKDEEE